MCVSEKSQGSLGLSRRIWRSILVRGTVVVLRITCGLGLASHLSGCEFGLGVLLQCLRLRLGKAASGWRVFSTSLKTEVTRSKRVAYTL